MLRRITLLIVTLLAISAPAQKKPLDARAYDSWRSVRSVALSDDGKWVVYALTPQDGDATVEVKAVDGSDVYTIERGSGMRFSEDNRFLICTVVPKSEEVKKASRAKAKPDDMPKNALTILELSTGKRTDLDRVTSFSLATHDIGYILYRPEPPKPAPKSEPKPSDPTEAKKDGPKADHRPGDTWILRNLTSGKEEKLENVTATRWSKDGTILAYTLSTSDGKGDGVGFENVKSGTRKIVVTALGKYPRFAISDATKDIAFATDKDDYAAKKPALSLYVYRAADGKSFKIDTGKLDKDFVASDHGSFDFSDKGTRLTFACVPKPEEEKKDETPEDEKVSVDIWNWQDPEMMPQQLLQVNADRARTYDAVYDLSTGEVAQLETPMMRSVTIGGKGDGDTALGMSNERYRKQDTWADSRFDYYMVDLRTGKATPLVSNFANRLSLSPTGKYAFGYDPESRQYVSFDMRNGKRIAISGLPKPIYDEADDHPSLPDAYGMAGWLKNDAGAIVYDKYDAWIVDPTGSRPPICLTKGAGRSAGVTLRLLRLDPEQDFVDVAAPLLFGAFNEKSKQAGFYKLADGRMDRLFLMDKAFGASGSPSAMKSRNAEVYAYQRMDTDEYPDVWLTDADLKNPRKVSEANPQQKDYNWVKSELVSWITNDGVPVQGVLYMPENFDPSKKYPLIAYYYERDSNNLHQYYSPAPSASTINITMYCSQGYLVFDPDIPYKVGYPGESAMSSILPGVQSLVARGFVDPKRLGIQGQSWGGYETGYLVTETNMFAAACAGAPVSDMVSAYGGIRWESGVSREGQYERGQSRIGGSLWEQPLRFIENSPIFFADKIQTPLLIMSNDKDGAVPWYQGIEYFSAMRRLNKPAWLVCYNEEAHNLVQRKNRKDWSIRMQQFFDHYLKGAPMPVWMSQGVPATKKGKDYGFELDPGTWRR